MYLLYAVIFILLSVIDRFLLKRRKVELISVNYLEPDNQNDLYLKFSLDFFSKRNLISSELMYTLRDKNNPTTVITGKSRSLNFSKIGKNSEYLLIKKSLIDETGYWTLDVSVTTTGSKINPLYKIFPQKTHLKKEFFIHGTKK